MSKNKVLKIIGYFLIILFFILTAETIYIFNNKPAIIIETEIKIAKKLLFYKKDNYAFRLLEIASDKQLKMDSDPGLRIKPKINRIDFQKILNSRQTEALNSKISIDFSKKPIESNANKISNIYYKTGIYLYGLGFDHEATLILENSVILNPELSFLHIELADIYLKNNDENGFINVLNNCQLYSWARVHCKDYKENIIDGTIEPFEIGYFENTLEHYQFK